MLNSFAPEFLNFMLEEDSFLKFLYQEDKNDIHSSPGRRKYTLST